MAEIDKITISDPQDVRSVTLTAEELERTANVLEQVVEETPNHIEPKFVHAPVVEEVANRLISTVNQFGHLAEAKIAYLFRTGEWMTKGRWEMGKAYVNDERLKFLTGYDLQVVVSDRIWYMTHGIQREALIAHQLCHFERKEPDKHGNPRWGLASHDLEEFAYVVRKYGIWDESLREFMAAYQKGETERRQVPMFEDEEEVGA